MPKSHLPWLDYKGHLWIIEWMVMVMWKRCGKDGRGDGRWELEGEWRKVEITKLKTEVVEEVKMLATVSWIVIIEYNLL